MSKCLQFLKDSMEISHDRTDDMLTLFAQCRSLDLLQVQRRDLPELFGPTPGPRLSRERSGCRVAEKTCQALAPEVGRINRRAKAQLNGERLAGVSFLSYFPI